VPADLPPLTAVELRRTVLARQRLTARSGEDLADVVSGAASLQAQYAPSMYVGLWSRVEGLRREDLTVALEERRVVQGTMMRSTIHLAAIRDYWPLNLAVRASRRTWFLRQRGVEEATVLAAAEATRAAFRATDVLTRRQLEDVAGPSSSYVGLFVDLVRAPPSGTWERRRADLFALAEQWIGPPPELDEDDAWRYLVRHHLTGFGPASAHEIASWAGVNVGTVNRTVATMDLTRWRAADGAVLLDLPELDIAGPTTPLPVRFIGTWEALLLVHARRAEILAEDDRPRIFGVRTPQSFNTFLVDGTVRGTWQVAEGRIVTTPWRPLTAAERAAVAEEADALADFHA
jgi:hypothetical protein